MLDRIAKVNRMEGTVFLAVWGLLLVLLQVNFYGLLPHLFLGAIHLALTSRDKRKHVELTPQERSTLLIANVLYLVSLALILWRLCQML